MTLHFNIDIAHIIPIIKILLSTCIGYVIGRERKSHEKTGGSRTLALVMLGSTLLSILSLELIQTFNFDFVRLMSYGVAGIGFLGSGIIMKNKNNIEGLTTASTLFVMMPLGFLVGLGFYSLALVTSIIVYFLLEIKYTKIGARRK